MTGPIHEPRGFVLLAMAALLAPPALVAVTAERTTGLPETPDQRRAVAVATRRLAEIPQYRYALDRTPAVKEGWTSYAVYFPPACSITGHAGPVIFVAKGSFSPREGPQEEAVCVPDEEGWLARARGERSR